MHVKAPTAAAIRSMCDLGEPQTQPDVIDWESILRNETMPEPLKTVERRKREREGWIYGHKWPTRLKRIAFE